MTEEKLDVEEKDTMMLVFFHKSSGHFTFSKLTQFGKDRMDAGEGIALDGVYEEWSDYMEPSEFIEALEEIVRGE